MSFLAVPLMVMDPELRRAFNFPRLAGLLSGTVNSLASCAAAMEKLMSIIPSISMNTPVLTTYFFICKNLKFFLSQVDIAIERLKIQMDVSLTNAIPVAAQLVPYPLFVLFFLQRHGKQYKVIQVCIEVAVKAFKAQC